MYRARERNTSKIVALKQVRIPADERHNGMPITALREMSILRSLKHRNIVNVTEVAVGDDLMDDVFMVMEYCEQVCFYDPSHRSPLGLYERRRSRWLISHAKQAWDIYNRGI